MTKFTRVRDFPLLESALFVLMSYSTFLIAEASDLTGITITIFYILTTINFFVRCCRCTILRYMPGPLHLQQSL